MKFLIRYGWIVLLALAVGLVAVPNSFVSIIKPAYNRPPLGAVLPSKLSSPGIPRTSIVIVLSGCACNDDLVTTLRKQVPATISIVVGIPASKEASLLVNALQLRNTYFVFEPSLVTKSELDCPFLPRVFAYSRGGIVYRQTAFDGSLEFEVSRAIIAINESKMR